MTPFEFHTGFEAVEKTTGKGEKIWEMDCPFCAKESHFHHFEDTRWNCKVCGRSGNNYTFIGLIYEMCSIGDIKDLADHRQLPHRVFVHNGIRLNTHNGTYVIPTFKEGKLNNLLKYDIRQTKPKVMGTPGLPSTLFNWPEVTEDEIWICEGHWDKPAADAIIGQNRPITTIGIPGAGSFKEAWCNVLRDKNVVFFPDNDESGERGLEKILEILKKSPQKPKKISRVHWPKGYPEKGDLRDFYIKHGRKSYKEVEPLLQEIEEEAAVKVSTENIIEDFECDSYDKALESFQTAYHTTDDTKHGLAACMASIYSVKLDGEQMWMKMIGPPGCGKTSIARALSASDQVVSRSTFKGLFSGWHDSEDEDPGMIPEISGKTLFVKDADTLLKQPNVEQIMSELRDFYDKYSSITYRNRRKYDYADVRTTVIICGTQFLRRADQSFLGERFLAFEMNLSPSDELAILEKMYDKTTDMAMGRTQNPETKIMSAMKGWINHLMSRDIDSEVPKDFKQLLFILSKLTALLRTSIDRDLKRKILSPPMPEVPTRLLGQMNKATHALCTVYGVNKPSEDVFKVITKIFRDTINPRSTRYSVCEFLLENPNACAMDLQTHLPQLQKTAINEELEDLLALNLLKVRALPGSGPGRKRKGLSLIDNIRGPFKEIIQ